MPRRLFAILVCWLGLLAHPAWAVERGALFKVTGHKHTMYLFGTIHVGLPEFYPLDTSVTTALAGATTLALEIDPTAQTQEASAMVARAGRTTPDVVAAMPPALGPRLTHRLEAMGAPATLATQLKPWMLMMAMTVIEYAKLGYRTDLAVDAHLAKLAHDQKIKVIGLETIESQIDVFNGLSAADQWTMLDETVASMDSGEAAQDVQALTNGWARADAPTLDALARKFENDERLSTRILQRRMLTERNGPMADKLDGLLKRENKSMAAVGLMHLIGNDSLPVLLQAKGLKVERVY